MRVEAALMYTRIIAIIPMSKYPKRMAVNVPGMLFTIRSVGGGWGCGREWVREYLTPFRAG